jgi:hypothetical protein
VSREPEDRPAAFRNPYGMKTQSGADGGVCSSGRSGGEIDSSSEGINELISKRGSWGMKLARKKEWQVYGNVQVMEDSLFEGLNAGYLYRKEMTIAHNMQANSPVR